MSRENKQWYIDNKKTITRQEIDALHLTAAERIHKHNATIFHPKDGLYYIWNDKLMIEDDGNNQGENHERSVAENLKSE